MTEKMKNPEVKQVNPASQHTDKERIYLFDNIKFILIILVVVGHFANVFCDRYPSFKSVYLFIYIFHMPLFIFISGMFHRNNNIKEKVLMFFFLGYSEKLLRFLVSIIGNKKNPNMDVFEDNGLPWFMFCMAAFILITYLARGINKKYLLCFSIVLMLAAGYDKEIGDFLYLSRIFVFYPYYILGTMTSPEMIMKINKKKIFKFGSIIVFILAAVACFRLLDTSYALRQFYTGCHPYPKNHYLTGPLIRIFCYITSFLMFIPFFAFVPAKKIPVVSEFGKRTLQVYYWSDLVRLPLINLYKSQLLIFTATFLGKAVYLILSAVLALILLTKPFGIIVNQIRNMENIKIKKD